MFLLNAEIKSALKHEQARKFRPPRHAELDPRRGPRSRPRRRCQRQAGGCRASAARWAPSRSGACRAGAAPLHVPALDPPGTPRPPGVLGLPRAQGASRGGAAHAATAARRRRDGRAPHAGMSSSVQGAQPAPSSMPPGTAAERVKERQGLRNAAPSERTGGPSRDARQHLMHRQSAEVQ